jgi:hypothetical protein
MITGSHQSCVEIDGAGNCSYTAIKPHTQPTSTTRWEVRTLPPTTAAESLGRRMVPSGMMNRMGPKQPWMGAHMSGQSTTISSWRGSHVASTASNLGALGTGNTPTHPRITLNQSTPRM